ncbi:MAG: 3-deoxy-7-phosphoheptulonate synthase [Candidatus Hydrogenedentota bacterium]
MERTQDLHIESLTPLVPPRELKEELPMSAAANRTVVEGRDAIKRILSKEDPRLLAVVGPCSIHDSAAAIDYAERLAALSKQVSDRLCLVMRVYFEKPRTTVGWKGLINDPGMDGCCDLDRGLRLARGLLLKINELGAPCATELLGPIIPQYITDLISWAAIGARTTESQTHREMASGLSMPVGYKNNTDGGVDSACNAMVSARHAHSFLGMDLDGKISLVRTRGNPDGHIILRGGKDRPNYDAASIAEARQKLKKAGLEPTLMVDCSHANSGKKHAHQEAVWRATLKQRVEGDDGIIGMSLESNIHEGNQAIPNDPAQLQYGVSVTDECISWETTERLIRFAHQELGKTPAPAGA